LQHSIEQWIDRINTMKDLCIQAHRVRNEYSELADQKFDKQHCTHLLEQVQSMARGIANEKITEIKTEMDSWKK
tara:strand:- start:2 stop:223 length:222 start_codon:yes stop_codon:yes gene_type:complete